MNIKTKTIVFLFAALIFFSLHKNLVLAGGFGVSPADIINKNLVPGSSFEEDLILVQNTPDVDLNAVAVIDAGKINDWIKIEGGNNFIIPKGVQQFPIKVDISVPQDAALGEYKGAITINASPAGKQAAGVSVNIGVIAGIDLGITNMKISKFSIQNFRIPDVAKGSPIKFLVMVKNEGNVENGPTKVGLTFFDQYHAKQQGQQELPITEKAGPFQIKDISLDFTNNLDVGDHWADVKIYSEDKIIIDSKVIFAVTSGAAAKFVKISALNLSVIPIWAYILAGVIIVLIFVAVVIILVLRKKKKHQIVHKK